MGSHRHTLQAIAEAAAAWRVPPPRAAVYSLNELALANALHPSKDDAPARPRDARTPTSARLRSRPSAAGPNHVCISPLARPEPGRAPSIKRRFKRGALQTTGAARESFPRRRPATTRTIRPSRPLAKVEKRARPWAKQLRTTSTGRYPNAFRTRGTRRYGRPRGAGARKKRREPLMRRGPTTYSSPAPDARRSKISFA